MTGPIEFSSEALEAFKRQSLKRQPTPRAVRLGVRGGACSGLQYSIAFDDEPVRIGDTEWCAGDVTFVIDKKSLLYLSGSRIVWTKTFMSEGFSFENPNEASRCGCGQSFSAK